MFCFCLEMRLGLQRAEVFEVLYQSERILIDEAAFDAWLGLRFNQAKFVVLVMV
ncbi:MAG: hypothetical protein ACPGLY_10245 [Rubripirellula sp.]